MNRTECRMLAQSYAALHALSENALDKLALTAASTGAAEAVLTGIADAQTQLHDRIRQLETAMVRLGLTVIRPAEGDSFDGAYHVPVGTSVGAVGSTVVARCVTPGVMASGAKEAVLRAEVELQ